MLELKNISIDLSVNNRKIAENFSFILNQRDKAVIIGEEGNGKSTLLKLIYDERQVSDYCGYTGQIIRKGKLAYLPQFFPEEYLDYNVEQYFADTEPARHVRIFSRLGLSLDFTSSSQVVRTLSGGEKIKIQLAKILMSQPDILLLDEPTNDIDLETLDWLEGFINNCEQPLLYISHDETLIENTANIIIHMEQLVRKTKSKITVARGGYVDYVKARNLAYDKQTQVAKKQRSDHKAQMERWQQIYNRVDHEQRNISKAGRDGEGRKLKKKMQSVKSTGKRLEHQADDFLDIPQIEQAILTQFDPKISIPHGKEILSLDLPELCAGEKKLSGSIRLNVTGPRHVGIIGRNGAGKSTLLREIWAALKERADITAAYMPQDYAEVLNYDRTAVGFLAADSDKETITKARTFLGGMKFTQDEMLGRIGRLSGGQKAKILFLDMVLRNANVLILDEPTRNFSPLSAPEIRKTLALFNGAVISVSHDRKYLDEVCDVVYELTGEGVFVYR